MVAFDDVWKQDLGDGLSQPLATGLRAIDGIITAGRLVNAYKVRLLRGLNM